MIRVATNKDLPALTECHIACFPHSFASKLGPACVNRSFEWFLSGSNRFLLILEHDVTNELIGFCGGFAPRFVADGGKAGMLSFSLFQALQSLLRRPALLLKKDLWRYAGVFLKNRIICAFGISQKCRRPSADELLYIQSVSLATIGVHPSHRQKGYSYQLLAAFEEAACPIGRKNLMLSVRKNNTAAKVCYFNTGWCIYQEHGDTFILTKPVAQAISSTKTKPQTRSISLQA